MGEELIRYRDLGLSRAGLRHRLETGVLSRVSRGIYARRPPESLDCLRALFLRLPPGVLLCDESAADLYGFGVRPADAVHVMVPAGRCRPKIHGVVAHEAVLPVDEPASVFGVPCIPPARCAVDLARRGGRLGAIAVLDAAVRSGACAHDDLMAEVSRHDGLRRVRQVRELVPLADPRAECPQESHLRLVVIDGGLPPPEPQVWVYDEYGEPRYRVDLAYRERRVGLEYDGRSHLDRDRMSADRVRMNWLDERRWTMRYFTAHDVYRRPANVVATVRAALS